MGLQELAVVGLAGSGVGTALGVPMVWPRRRQPRDVRLLGTALLLLSGIVALISARLAGFVADSAEVDHAVNVLGLCGSPLIVAYVWQATKANSSPPRWCFAPLVAYLAWVGLRSLAGLDTRVPFVWLLPILLAFTGVAAAALYRHRPRRDTMLIPAEWVVAFVVAVNVAQIVRMEWGHVTVIRAIVPLVMSCGFVALVVFVAWRTASMTAPAAPGTRPEVPRYERSGLDEAAAPGLVARIERALTVERLFARHDLTLRQLATAVGAAPHDVSEALNRYAGVSFHELLNRRRVEEVKAQLLDPDCDRFTIEGIGLAAGFGSRSALYSTFRRLEGMTPTAFRARHRPVLPAAAENRNS